MSTSESSAKKYAFYYKRDLSLDEPRKVLAASHWPASEIKYHNDAEQYGQLLCSQKQKDKDMIIFVNNILCLFQQLDGMVVENLFDNFIHELSEYKEIRDFFIVQENNELVHSQSYGDQMNACIKDARIRQEMIEADISKYPAVNKIIQWSSQWFDTNLPIEERLVAFAAIEGVIFTAAFVAIYRLKELNMFPGICKANEFISKDEGMHTAAGIHFFKYICKSRGTSVSQERIHEIVRSATELSCEFAKDAVQPDLIGLRVEDLTKYMKLTGNKLAEEFGCEAIFSKDEASCPFEWMSKICMFNLTNFFESRVSEYKDVAISDENLNANLDNIDF